MTKRPVSYAARAALAGATLYYAQDLSRGDRHAVDWVVLALVAAAIAWNLVQLGRLLLRAGGGRALWHLQRTVLFWILGLRNTAWVRPEDVGTWTHVVGYALLGIAALDTVALAVKEHRIASAERDDGVRAAQG